MKAFPRPNTVHPDDLGMDLRDYFAAKAMQAYFTDSSVSWNEETQKLGAERAYQLADVMMEARKS